jgi:hypothetical protein
VGLVFSFHSFVTLKFSEGDVIRVAESTGCLHPEATRSYLPRFEHLVHRSSPPFPPNNMRPAIIILALAQTATIVAAPTKLAERDAYWQDDDSPSRYLR